jgi:recombination protein RecA
MKRPKLVDDSGGMYFEPEAPLQRFSSGCRLFDCALGGGWVRGRVINVVGDRSTGKTLVAIEACTNFLTVFPEGFVDYGEAEAAFEKRHARALGMPIEKVRFVRESREKKKKTFDTIEDLFEDIDWRLSKMSGEPGLYVVDSLDALSDDTEMAEADDKGSYGTAKAKKLSKMFRKRIRQMEAKGLTVLIVSQIRDKIGISFGKKYNRSGGHALDFYATHIVWLAHIGMLSKVRNGIKRVVGVSIKAKVEKNKVGPAHREVDFPIVFGYGIDDVAAAVEWLDTVDRLDKAAGDGVSKKTYLKEIEASTPEEFQAHRKKLNKAVRRAWREVEDSFAPKRSKYGA